MNAVERRYLAQPLELRKKADADKDQIQGYAAVFNSRSDLIFDFYEEIAPGAFSRTLKESDDIKALFNHQPNLVLGSTAARTLELAEDKTGLRYLIDPPDTTTGRDVTVLIARGDISKSSFGFIPRADRWANLDGEIVRTLLDVDLLDVSPVTYPAYPETSVDVRSKVEALRKAYVVLPGVDILRRKLDLLERI